MKKMLIIIFLLMILFFLIKNEETLIIPKDSIRFRVIANSNKEEDIKVKEYLVNEIMQNETSIFSNLSINETRNKINDNIENVKKIVSNTFEKLDYSKKIDVNYGINYFPEKIYKGVKYDSGYYESLVITIGEGKGNNYWCVMFPPLCMVDENVSNREYKFKIAEIIEKYIINK